MNGRRARVAVLVAAGVLAGLGAVAGACGDGPDQPAPLGEPTQRGGAGTRNEPILQGPAGRFIPTKEEIRGTYALNAQETYGYQADNFAQTNVFKSPEEGAEFVRRVGYVEGYRVYFEPDGLLAGVAKGGYYPEIEAHMFETVEGAREMFARFVEVSAKVQGSQPQSTAAVGNEHSAFRLVLGQIAGEERVYYRYIFRRGNLVGVIQTVGAARLITVDTAKDIAITMDDRALGRRQAFPPTPIPVPTFARP